MLPKEIIKKIRRIEIYTKALVNDIFSGEYHSVFKGRGMEFSEVREYQSGDDIRLIDWNVTARMGHLYVKKFIEERELTVLLLVDASSSGEFGTVRQVKKDIAIEICSLIAFSAIKNNDRIGLVIFTDRIEKFIPPKKGKNHALTVISEMLAFKPSGKRTDLNCVLEFAGKVFKRKSVLFLVSDFITRGFEKSMRIANKRHDLIGIKITDPREIEMPKMGFVELQDAETNEYVLVDTNSGRVRRTFAGLCLKEKSEKERTFNSIGVDMVNVTTDKSYIAPLVNFFKMRANKFR